MVDEKLPSVAVPADEIIAFLRSEFAEDLELIFGDQTEEAVQRIRDRHIRYGIDSSSVWKFRLLSKLLNELEPRPSGQANDIALRKLEEFLTSRIELYTEKSLRAANSGKRDFLGVDYAYLQTWHTKTSPSPDEHFLFRLFDLLEKCPDRPGVERLSAFGVVKAQAYRRLLLEDLHEVEVALEAGAWKSATVMAGSLIEALLFYRLDVERHASDAKRVEAFKRAQPVDRTSKLPKELEKLGLSELAQFSLKLGIISKDERVRIDQIGDFRNLVHPGKSYRLNERCDRATAYLVYSALLMLDRNLRNA